MNAHFGLALTVLYIATVLWLVWADVRELPELPLNELGDFLAGVFAPLAFLWFVMAVFIQSQELGAQRRELALTRMEVKQNRDVAKAQADEAKKQAEAMEAQSEHFRNEALKRTQETKDAHFVEQLTSLREWAFSELTSTIDIIGDRDAHFMPLGGRKLPTDNELALNHLCRRLRGIERTIEKKEDGGRKKALTIKQGHALEMLTRLERISELIDTVSPEQRKAIKGHELSAAINAARFILDRSSP